MEIHPVHTLILPFLATLGIADNFTTFILLHFQECFTVGVTSYAAFSDLHLSSKNIQQMLDIRKLLSVTWVTELVSILLL